MNGNSRAVRILAEFRLATDQVQISRSPNGDLIIHPCPARRGQSLFDTLAGARAGTAEAVIYLLDTNILIYLIKNRPPLVAERIDQLADSDSLARSFITWAELLPGAEGCQHRAATLQQLDALARQVPVLVPDGAAISGSPPTPWPSKLWSGPSEPGPTP